MKEKEKWLPVKGHSGRYSISSFGRVKSHQRTDKRGWSINEKILSGTIDSDGYRAYTLYNYDGTYKKIHAQRLVAIHFIDNLDDKPTVNHKDGIKTNNHINNLEWATHSEQTIHAIAIGLIVFRKGIVFTEEHKAKISAATMGRIPWNKGKRGVQVAWNKGLKQKTN